jgi:hypothetical protein
MSLKRRRFLALTGGGVVLAAGGLGGGFAATRTPRRAIEPWTAAGSAYREPRLRALSYAILAPNPHNLQPWKVDISQEGKAILYVDTARLLPETDPFSRQITIGLGCFLGLLEMAAAEDGYRTHTDLYPDGSDDTRPDERPVAVVRFEEDATAARDPLFSQVLLRRSTKEPYDLARPVEEESLRALEAVALPGAAVRAEAEAGIVETLRELTWNAWLVEYTTPAKLRESIDVMRLGKREIEANPDGIDVGGGMLEFLIVSRIITREALADPSSFAFRTGEDMYRAMCDTSQAFVWVNTPANTRRDQIAAGLSWLRVNLEATRLNLGVQPMSQALQEYPEMQEYYDEAHRMLASGGETVQMLGRLGYSQSVPPSPRWGIEHKLIG